MRIPGTVVALIDKGSLVYEGNFGLKIDLLTNHELFDPSEKTREEHRVLKRVRVGVERVIGRLKHYFYVRSHKSNLTIAYDHSWKLVLFAHF